MTTLTQHPNAIAVEIVHNVRHLGGKRVTSGGVTAAHNVLRSASLRELTVSGACTLRELGIETIVDLRSPGEWEREPTPDVSANGIKIVQAAVFRGDVSPGAYKAFNGHASSYRRLLREGGPAYRTLVETVASSEGGVLFHCAAGKDRTGLAAALLLSLAGVGEEYVAADYALSQTLLEPLMGRWLDEAEELGIPLEVARELISAREEVMLQTLDHIDEVWGGAESYLRSAGVSAKDLERARRRLVEARR